MKWWRRWKRNRELNKLRTVPRPVSRALRVPPTTLVLHVPVGRALLDPPKTLRERGELANYVASQAAVAASYAVRERFPIDWSPTRERRSNGL